MTSAALTAAPAMNIAATTLIARMIGRRGSYVFESLTTLLPFYRPCQPSQARRRRPLTFLGPLAFSFRPACSAFWVSARA
jgi:hypothetical protein